MIRRSVITLTVFLSLVAAGDARAQGGDLTIFGGLAYPAYDERLTLRPSVPSLPGVDVTVAGSPQIKADGGPVFGGALAFELGVLGIEGRLDATNVGFDLTGARYDLRATAPPFTGLTGSVSVADGRLDADRIYLLSLNARVRTPGPVGIFASGGLSLLPSIDITGAVDVSAQIAGISVADSGRLRLRIAPGESDRRFGVNAGGGVRIGGQRVALMGEIRAFYFQEYELRFAVDGAPELVSDLLQSVDPIRFEPVIVNAQAGLVFRF